MNKYAVKNRALLYEECVSVGDDIYFVSATDNGLYRFRQGNDDAELVGAFPNEKLSKFRLYRSLTVIDDKIILAPCNASKIVVYYFKTDKCISIPIREPARKRNTWANSNNPYHFWDSICYGNYIYFIGMGYPAIIKMSLSDFSLCYIDEWTKEVDNNVSYEGNIEPYLSKGIVIRNKGFFPIMCVGGILEINFDTDEIKIIKICQEICGFNGIMFDGTYFWITPRYWHELIRYDYSDAEVKKIKIVPKNDTLVPPYHSPIDMGDRVLLSPISASNFLIVHKDSLAVSEEEQLTKIINKSHRDALSYIDTVNGVKLKKNELEFFKGSDFSLNKYNFETKERSYSYIYADKMGTIIKQQAPFASSDTITESIQIKLSNLLDYLQEEKSDSEIKYLQFIENN